MELEFTIEPQEGRIAVSRFIALAEMFPGIELKVNWGEDIGLTLSWEDGVPYDEAPQRDHSPLNSLVEHLLPYRDPKSIRGGSLSEETRGALERVLASPQVASVLEADRIIQAKRERH